LIIFFEAEVLTGDAYKSERLGEFFPLFTRGDFGIVTDPNLGWQVGIEAAAPVSLQKRVAAALIADSLRLKSLDYAYRRYMDNNDIDYHRASTQRIDLRIAVFIDEMMKALGHITNNFSDETSDKSYGQSLSEWTLSRIPFSMPILLYVANRGALYEGIAVARLIFELLSFAHYVYDKSDDKLIKNLSANTTISSLKKVNPGAGKLYGWMSSHAHWEFEAHKKSVVSSEVEFGFSHLLACPHFKAIILSVILNLTVVTYDIVWVVHHRNVQPHKTVLGDTIRPKTVRDHAKSLLNEISRCDDESKDLKMLATNLDIRVVK
jgi:hypothetical protein